MESHDIVCGRLQMLQVTSRPGSSHIRLGSVNLLSILDIHTGEAAAESDLSTLLKVNPVELATFYHSI